MRKFMIATALTAMAFPAAAQVNTSGGLVNVNVQNVDILKNFLNNSQVSVLDNVSAPITVQVPIGVAANVCGIAANVLTANMKQDPTYSCDAKNGSQALTQQVIKQQHAQNK